MLTRPSKSASPSVMLDDLLLDAVVLVLDLADDLLEQVLEW